MRSDWKKNIFVVRVVGLFACTNDFAYRKLANAGNDREEEEQDNVRLNVNESAQGNRDEKERTARPDGDMIRARRDKMDKTSKAHRLEMRDGLRVMQTRDSRVERTPRNVIAGVEAAGNIAMQDDTSEC
jgi:hypothetical protein